MREFHSSQGQIWLLRDTILATLSRFSLIGLMATITYFVVANVLMLLQVAAPTTASVIAYCAGMVVSFLGQSRFTFRVLETKFGHFLRFCVLSLCGVLVSYWSVRLTGEMLHVSPVWGTVVTSVTVPLISFMIMKYWVFDATNP